MSTIGSGVALADNTGAEQVVPVAGWVFDVAVVPTVKAGAYDGFLQAGRQRPRNTRRAGAWRAETVVIPKGENQAAQIEAFFAAGVNKREAVVSDDVPRLFTEAEVKALIEQQKGS